MSLISQNVVVKTKVKRKSKSKSKDDEGDETILVDHVEEIVEEGDLNVDEGGNRKKKKKRSQEEVEAMKIEEQLEMEQLGSLLFGSLHSPIEFGKGGNDEVEIKGGDDSALFVMDRSGNKELSVYEDDGVARYVVGVNDEDGVKERRPVWVDDEEEEATVDISNVNRLRKLRKEEDERVISGAAYVARLRAQHAKLNPATEWARLDSSKKGYDSDADSEVENGELVANGDRSLGNFDDILQTNEDVVVKRGAKLLPGILEYSRLVDANAEDPSNARINSVQFHRNHQLLLTAGHDKKLRFFQIDGKRNKMMDTIFFEDCPIFNASFLPDGSQVIVSGRRKFFYSVDISKGSVDKIGPLTGREEKSLEFFEVSPDSRTIAFVGNEGYILLVSSKTKELIGTLKMNGTVRSLAFSADGQKLLSSGGDGQIYHWDLRTRTCFHKGVDQGSIVGTALCTSPIGNLFASGSDSGIVNVYNRDEFLGGNRKPIKKIDNLTTEVHEMKFNHDAQILAICSRNGKSSLKLVHVPSFTVFSNWPPPNRSLAVPRCLDFSPAGGFMAIGNAAGKVQLYKLNHYQRA